MAWLQILVDVLFALLGGICVASVALGLPGTWVLLALALAVEFTDGLYLPGDAPQTFSWSLLIACGLAAAVGEALEFAAGVVGAKRSGSSTRGAWGAFLGGLLGAIAGIAIPIPIVGSLIGALLGTFAGAVAGELTLPGAQVRSSLKPATGATVGRVLGTLSKIPIALLVWLALSFAAFYG